MTTMDERVARLLRQYKTGDLVRAVETVVYGTGEEVPEGTVGRVQQTITTRYVREEVPMTDEEENAIVNASAETLMKGLATNGRSVEAVVTVVLFKGGEKSHIAATLDLEHPPTDQDEVDRAQAGILLVVADLLDTYVHERGLCENCNREKGNIQ